MVKCLPWHSMSYKAGFLRAKYPPSRTTMTKAIIITHRLSTLIFAALLAGCGSMLPTEKTIVKSPWGSFDAAKAAFDKITPYETTADDLKGLGFDPYTTPNISILNYLDIMKLFDYDPEHEDSLAEGIRSCLAAKELCHAYDVEAADIKRKRTGSVFLDMFKFKRKTYSSGWRFKALIFMIDGQVVYKMWGGKPIVDEFEEKKKPLGPLQDIGSPSLKI